MVLVSAEAASSDDFLQWAADVGVQGKLDRVVIDECHFTAADEYWGKLSSEDCAVHTQSRIYPLQNNR